MKDSTFLFLSFLSPVAGLLTAIAMFFVFTTLHPTFLSPRGPSGDIVIDEKSFGPQLPPSE
jgi:hypothetical protein